jgi:release factor glutamine methyltransferase
VSSGSDLAPELARDLSSQGVRPLLLRGPGAEGAASFRSPEEPTGLELLVRPDDAAAARAALEERDWNYQLGSPATWRTHPVVAYSWAEAPYLWRQAPAVELSWGITASPLPLGAFGELERLLWQGASDHPSGWALPDAASLAVYLALQAARGGPRKEERIRHLADCLSDATWERADRTAARCGIRRAFRAAAAELPQAGGVTGRDARSPYDRTVLRAAWSAGSVLGARAFPRRLRPWISRSVGFGGSPVRCRFAGVEVLAGPGAFVPELPSRRLVELASKELAGRRAPVVVEPGAGSGAISLAIAARHPEATVHAVEKHRAAYRWAKRNARRQGRVRVHRGSLLDPVPKSFLGRVDVIVANLPYVPSRVWGGKGRFVRESVRGHDDDGLGLYRRLTRQARPFLRPGGSLILEMGPYQVGTFRSEASSLGYTIDDVQPELLGAVVVTARLPAGASSEAAGA